MSSELNPRINHQRRQHLLIGAALILITLTLSTAALLWQEWRDAKAQVAVNTQNLAKSLDQSIEAMLSSMDYSLQVASDEIIRQQATGRIDTREINEFLSRQQAKLPFIDLLRASNADGEVLYGKGVDPTLRASVSLRDYYQRLKADPKLEHVLSEPIIGKLSQRWIWLMARRIRQPDGSFGGLVYGSMFAEDLQKRFEQLRLPTSSVVVLRDENMHLVARSAFDNTQPIPTGDATITPAFREALSLNPQEGSYDTGQRSLDGIRRIYSYRKNARFGYVISVGIPMSAVVDSWQQRSLPILGFLLVFGLGTGFFVLSINRGWTQQENDLEALTESQHRFAQIVELNPLAMGIYATDGRIELINRKAIELIGYTLEDIPHLDRWFFKAYPDLIYRESSRARWYAALEEAMINTGVVDAMDFEVTCKDGTVKMLTFSGVVLSDKVLVLIEDKTAARLAEQNLIEARQQSERASRAKSSFLANMSHEIRTPMNAILGFAHMLSRDPLTPGQSERVGRITAAGEHLLSVINDVLDISKIEAGKIELEIIDFELDELLRRVASIITLRAQAKRLELVIDVQGLPPILRGDPTRLSQILINYLGNAVKFTGDGHVILRGRVLEERENDLLIRFEVEDTGIGIGGEQLSTVFDAFEQADLSTTRRYGGTGLGLAISKRLAEMMGGRVGVSSLLGRGSTFWVSARVGQPAASQATAIPHHHPALVGKRVLVADDLAITQLVHSQLVKKLGMRPMVVISGEEAILAIDAANGEGDPVEVALIDLNMAGMDGLAALDQIRHLKLDYQPCCILVTASGDPHIADSARQAGFDNVLTKPISLELLERCLLDALNPGATTSAIPAGSSESPADEPSVPDGSEEHLRRDFSDARILLVEDDPTNQMIACEFLQTVGLTPVIANHGAEAVNFVEQEKFDLILSDIQMPVMDGLEATEKIRLLPNGQYVPILAMTANVFADDRERCLAAGMDDFIAKPINPERLFACLEKWLSASRARQSD